MRNYLLLLALAGARACTPGTNLPNAKKCCPDGTESPYYNASGSLTCGQYAFFQSDIAVSGGQKRLQAGDLPRRRHDGGVEDLSPYFPE